MKKNGHTDKSFGAVIGRSRLTVFRYRKGHQLARPHIAEKIEAVTDGEVTYAHLYQLWVRHQAALRGEVAA